MLNKRFIRSSWTKLNLSMFSSNKDNNAPLSQSCCEVQVSKVCLWLAQVALSRAHDWSECKWFTIFGHQFGSIFQMTNAHIRCSGNSISTCGMQNNICTGLISKRLQINQISIHWGLVKSILGHKYSGILDSYKKERGSSLCTHRERSPRYIALERKRMVCCNASICVLVCLENISGRIHSISATAAVMFREGKWGAKKGGGLLWVWTMCT